MTSVIIPVSEFNASAYEIDSYTPKTDIWNFNFSINFNHTKHNPVGSNKYMQSIFWKTVVMKDI